jgi:polar amino acid transport system substrate-binding protein
MRIRRPMALGMAAPMSATVCAMVLFLALGCAPVDSSSPDAGEDPDPTESTSETTDAAPVADPAGCAADAVRESGTLTIGTDSPAFDPWFSQNDPTNGEGFESAVAYAVAEKLGFTGDQVQWTKVPFNSSYAPGPKKFDFDINQISITAARAKAVDFSDGYYQASQAVIMLKGDGAEGVTSVEQLKGMQLGAQTGTTSLTAIRDVIQPDSDAVVFKDTSAAKQALMNGQVDAILADLPTAFYITAVEIPKGTIVGQFQPETGEQEEFGMLFEKGSPLVECVNQALTLLTDDGTLQAIEDQWLSDVVDVPELTP